VAKALYITYINCPVRQLADVAIEKHTVPGLLPQASLRGAQNQPVFKQDSIFSN